MQQMLLLMIDPHAQEGCRAVRVLVMRALACQIGEEHDASGTGCHCTSTRIEFIPAGTQYPVNPVEGEARVLHCRHAIPVDSVSSTVEVGAPGWVGERVWAELYQLRSCPQRQLDRSRGKQASPQAGRGGIGGTGLHRETRPEAPSAPPLGPKRPRPC